MTHGAGVAAGATIIADKTTYGQILRSSAIIGGSSVVNIGIGVVRTKAMALLLGPAGIGLFGLYGSIVDLAVSVAGLGVNSSGVRQIAEAVGTGDSDRVARTAAVLRRTSVVLGIFGALMLLLLSVPVARLTFGDDQHVIAVALLSLAVGFRLVAEGRLALLQGLRRMSDVAKINVFGAAAGLLITVPTVFFFGREGVVPSLVLAAGLVLAVTTWYSVKVVLPDSPMLRSQLRSELGPLLSLGLAFMVSAVMVMGVAYVIRLLVTRELGIEAAGLYQSAWTLGGLYVGLILQAMGADFYPRLTAVAADDSACNRVANEQAEISMWLAGPGVLATLTFAPLVIFLFYTSSFVGAVPLLRWFCLGVALRVISWPMGYIIIAKGNRRFFMGSEAAWAVVHIALAWPLINLFGLEGVGMAFFGSYVFHCCLTYALVRRLSGFRWSSASRRAGTIFISLVAAAFASFVFVPPVIAMCLGIAITAFGSYVSLRTLIKLVPPSKLPSYLSAPLARLGLFPPSGRR